MDNISDPYTENTAVLRTSPHQETVVSADGRTSVRDSEDPTQAPSFLGSKSDFVLSQTVSLTSLLSVRKTPVRDSAVTTIKKTRKSALHRHWEAQSRKTFPLHVSGSPVQKAKTASARHQSPRDSALNIGNSLYLKGLQMKETLKKKAQEILLNETLAEKKYFKPHVNENSNLMISRVHSSIEDSLLSWGSQKEEKLSRLKTSRTQTELEICPFSPKLDPKSLQMASQHPSDNPRFLTLYHLASEQKDRQTQYTAETQNSECPFRPRIFVEKRVSETKEEFIQRLYSSKARAKGGVGEEQGAEGGEEQADNGVIEEEPVQKVVERSDRPSNVTIYEYLYSLREKQPNSDSDAKPAPSPLEENTASHQVFSAFQQSCIASIFSALDTDRDGVLSGHISPIPSLSKKQFGVLKPVLKEVWKSQEQWDLQRFEDRVNQLIVGLNVEDRGYLLARVKGAGEIPAEKPSSRKVIPKGKPALRTERVSAVTSIQRPAKMREKLETERKLKESQECSFKPFLSSLTKQRYVASKSVH